MKSKKKKKKSNLELGLHTDTTDTVHTQCRDKAHRHTDTLSRQSRTVLSSKNDFTTRPFRGLARFWFGHRVSACHRVITIREQGKQHISPLWRGCILRGCPNIAFFFFNSLILKWAMHYRSIASSQEKVTHSECIAISSQQCLHKRRTEASCAHRFYS